MGKVVVIGSSNTDMVVRSARIPVPGETVIGGRFMMNAGGKGANQAVAAARMGGEVSFVAKVGDDMFGKEARRLFEKEGIDTSFVLVDRTEPSGVALIMVDEKSENCISVASGANGALHANDLMPVAGLIESADIVLMQLETPVDAAVHAARVAAAGNVPVILNPAPATALPDELFPLLY
ncbi:MAG: ribokinase, partial [Victivallaceae bacterium]|nr:ribokinase [Victivallaceae bacterium]